MATSLKPQKQVKGYAPLRELAKSSLRDFGDTSGGRGDGDALLFMIDAANMVLESVMVHAYWEGGVIDYYKSLDDVRPVPDLIIQTGLTAWLAVQRDSQKANQLGQIHNQMMSTILYRLKFGTGRVVHKKEIYDKNDGGYTGSGDNIRSSVLSDENT